MVGRTATQCLQRYQHLLDEAEARENEELCLAGDDAHGPSADDIRKLRPGEADPDPEAKPARPDPVDMDEDEKEMLSEARARLANTQGKKAKRKAREKQLEEARRLALLQKRRELKAAGINVRLRSKKKGGMDYNADIPFEKKPTLGFYDVTEEKYKTQTPVTSADLRQLERKRGAEDEDEARKKRQKKDKDQKEGKEKPLTAGQVAALQKMKEQEQVSRRRSLNLPAPQVGDAELEDIVKIGMSGENTRAMIDENGNELSAGLLAEYNALAAARDIRTPRVADGRDTIMNEARNLRLMTETQTPLLGEEATPLREEDGTGYNGITPRQGIASTPNPLATPLRNGSAGALSARDRVSSTPTRTPRDHYQLNAAGERLGPSSTPREARYREASAKHQLQQAFSSLPKPMNGFEIVLPEDELDDEADVAMTEEDAADRDARLAARKQAEEKVRLARRSQAVQKGLPRPASIDVSALMAAVPEGTDPESIVEAMIEKEMIKLVQHDAVMYPVSSSTSITRKVPKLENLSDDSLANARALVRSELDSMLPHDENTGAVIVPDINSFDKAWQEAHEETVFAPSRGLFLPADQITDTDKVANHRTEYDACKSKMISEAQRAAKIEKKLGLVLGGYQNRSTGLSEKFINKFAELNALSIEVDSFKDLSITESETAPARIKALEKEVTFLVDKETALQKRYAELANEKRDLQGQ